MKFGIRILIETGTFFGDMLAALRENFDSLMSIELDDALVKKAKQRFSDEPKIAILHGDSAHVISEVLASLHEPALFWLDGHFSGGVTAKGISRLLSSLN